ncbi:phosphodiesterase [Acrasis kona]|uniref:Phosphodiesterase n=1 Tax=Acrasis kona TaxID=1008807 RepID=A0AAW2Z762_9EUKA
MQRWVVFVTQFLKEVILFISQVLFTQNEAKIEHHNIKSENVIEEFNFVHLSDIHYDFSRTREKEKIFFNYQRVSKELLQSAINKINLHQDKNGPIHAILMTGDYIQYEPDAITGFIDDFLLPLITTVKPSEGTFMVLGNHDHKKKGSKKIITSCLQELKVKYNVHLLENEEDIRDSVFRLKRFNVEIIGFLDYHDPEFNTEYGKLKKISDPKQNHSTRIVLEHNPDTAALLRRESWFFDLMLCGHSHGGQIRVPIPSSLYPKLFDKYDTNIQNICGNTLMFVPLMLILSFLIDRMPSSISIWLRSRWIVMFILRVVKNWQYGKGGLVKVNDDPSLGGRFIYCNRGIATHPPLRFLCSPVVATFNIKKHD